LIVKSGESVARAKADLGITNTEDLAAKTLNHFRALTGAQYVVLGSYWYSWAGDKVDERNLDARLVDTASGETILLLPKTLLLNESGTKSKLWELVPRLAKPVRKQLGVGAASAADLRLARAAIPSSAEAFKLYAEGLSKLREYAPIQPTSGSIPPIKLARDLFEKAAKIAGDSALIHASLAEVLMQLGYRDE